MVSSRINDLNEQDLDYLDHLLHQEFSKQTQNSKQWQTKNGYHSPDRTEQLKKIMSAVQSQKKILTMPKW